MNNVSDIGDVFSDLFDLISNDEIFESNNLQLYLPKSINYNNETKLPREIKQFYLENQLFSYFQNIQNQNGIFIFEFEINAINKYNILNTQITIKPNNYDTIKLKKQIFVPNNIIDLINKIFGTTINNNITLSVLELYIYDIFVKNELKNQIGGLLSFFRKNKHSKEHSKEPLKNSSEKYKFKEKINIYNYFGEIGRAHV